MIEKVERYVMEVEIWKAQKNSNIVRAYFLMHGTAAAVNWLCLFASGKM